MIARVCAAQVARQIVRALHLPQAEQPIVIQSTPVKKKPVKGRKKRKAA